MTYRRSLIFIFRDHKNTSNGRYLSGNMDDTFWFQLFAESYFSDDFMILYLNSRVVIYREKISFQSRNEQ